MGKKITRLPPAPIIKELSAKDKEELEALGVGKGPFSKIMEQNIKLYKSDGWKEKKTDKKLGVLFEAKKSAHSDKLAARFTVNIPKANIGTLLAFLLDDLEFTDDPEKSAIYKFDSMLEENHCEKRFGTNLYVCRTNYKSPGMGVSPRQMVIYLELINLLSEEQQKALGVVPKSKKSSGGKELHVVAQCGIDYTGSEVKVKEGCVRGHTYHYLHLAQEEEDGSLTYTYVVDADPSGSIPSMFSGTVLDVQFKKVKKLTELMIAKGPQDSNLKVYENTVEFDPFKK